MMMTTVADRQVPAEYYDAGRLRRSFVNSTARLHHVHHAREELLAGRPVLLVDETADGVAGHLVLAAEGARTGAVAFMVRHSAGYLCVAMESTRCDQLALPPVWNAGEAAGLDHRVAVDAAVGVGTGISAADRARTAHVLADRATVAADLTRPGHVIPVAAGDAGVFGEGAGAPEAVVELIRATGHNPVGLYSAVVGMSDPTGIPDAQELARFATEHSLVVVTLNDIRMAVAHRAGDGVERSNVVVEFGSHRLLEVTGGPLSTPFHVLTESEPGPNAEVLVSVRTTAGPSALMAHVAADITETAPEGLIFIYLDASPEIARAVAPTIVVSALDMSGLTAASNSDAGGGGRVGRTRRRSKATGETADHRTAEPARC
ncbi:3,4-dihydroxy-2-butanone-4-phosphate synthase [Gordonia terrae]|uniref:3,4-dihydroxy-2-butanone-4-phosphate synthase n=1 Tax=Gordonia hongkongensis TaxID=1701090 RepID=UPI0022BFA676|nr:3,4-dihydroxy-2-butanone-4-phosphate synthase [Gordonia terrae]